MIPQTIGALVAFLALIAPGIFLERRREQRRLGPNESAFREASRIAVSSLWLTVATLTIMAIVRRIDSHIVLSPKELVFNSTDYFRDEFYLVLADSVAFLAISSMFALTTDWLLSKWASADGRTAKLLKLKSLGFRGTITHENGWYESLRKHRPKDTKVWVHVSMTNSTSFYGYLLSYTPEREPDKREITLEGPATVRVQPPRTPDGDPVKDNTGATWERVIIPSNQIAYIRIQYRNVETGDLIMSTMRREPQKVKG